MKKYVSIVIENDKTYEFEFADIAKAFGEDIVRLSKVNCSLEDKISLFNAGVVTCFSNADSLYVDTTKAKYVGFELR